jgi:hypothetical protein
VSRGIEWLKEQGATVVGLETMPRTMDNIGFYSRLGFLPGRLTLTVTIDAAAADRPSLLLGRLGTREKEQTLEECAALLGRLAPGYDYTREIVLTDDRSLGDTLLLRRGDEIAGFALCHTAPLVEGRAREELRVLKLVLANEALFEHATRALSDFARRSGTRRVAFRLQGEYTEIYQQLITLGGRVRWSDLRMVLDGYPELRPERGIVLSNWEI